MDHDPQLKEIADWLHDIAHVLNEIRVLMVSDATDDSRARSVTAKSLANPSVQFRNLPH